MCIGAGFRAFRVSQLFHFDPISNIETKIFLHKRIPKPLDYEVSFKKTLRLTRFPQLLQNRPNLSRILLANHFKGLTPINRPLKRGRSAAHLLLLSQGELLPLAPNSLHRLGALPNRQQKGASRAGPRPARCKEDAQEAELPDGPGIPPGAAEMCVPRFRVPGGREALCGRLS